MALFWGEGAQTPLVGSTVAQAMRRRLGELGGVALVALGLGLALALASYDPADPSHFSATPQPPVNWLGRGGAIVADPLMRLIGLGAWGFVLVLAVWGVRMVAHLGEERVWGRLPLVPVALVLGTVFASTHAAHQGWPLATGLGGMLGDNGVLALMGLIPLSPDLAIKLLGLGLGALVLGVGGAALGLTGREARGILAWLGRSLIEVAGVVGAHGWAGARAGARAGAQALAHARPAPRPRSERLGRAEPTGAWRAKLPDWRGMLRAAPAPDLPLSRLALPDDAPRATPRRREPNVTAPTPAADDNTALSAAIRALKASGDLAPDPVAPEPLPLGDTDTADPPPPPRAAVAHADARPKLSRQAQREREPELFEEDPAPDAPLYDAPPLGLLQRAIPVIRPQSPDLAFEENARMLETVLEDYGVRGEITAVKPGPVVTLYELEPAPGLKASRIIGLADDIARSMSALSARVCTVPGRSVIGIELPNAVREKVLLRELFETAAYGDSTVPLALALGKDIAGQPVIANLAKMPHLLIAGTTGSGKSVAINTMILSLLYRLSPQQCRLIMIDPKMLELSVYDNIPHLLAPVVTDPKKAVVALKWVVAEMEERYRKMSKVGVRNLDGYNARVRDAQGRGEAFTRVIQTGFDDTTGAPIYETETFEPEPLPFIVVIVDEMADLMMVAGKEIEACIQRLAQMARASGIHLIMATQRPSVDVITGTIKANFPTRISFQVTSKIDSRTILQEQGAEQLLGMGDMLHMAGGGRITRVHGPFVSDEEVEEVVRHLKTLGAPDYIGAVTDGGEDEAMAFDDRAGGDSDEELYDRAVAIVARDRKCSTSYIQRKLAIGYNKAARLVEQMEDLGVVSPANAVGKREILVEER